MNIRKRKLGGFHALNPRKGTLDSPGKQEENAPILIEPGTHQHSHVY
jgi:hypothetical protein